MKIEKGKAQEKLKKCENGRNSKWLFEQVQPQNQLTI